MHQRAFLGLALATTCVTACGGKELPPKICREAPPPSEVWYVEVTDQVGLAKTDALEPLGVNIIAADVDHDGWVDFYSAASTQREPPGTTRHRFLFMNRPDPNDASNRIFVDALDDSGLLATRDGQGGRGIIPLSFGDIDNDGDLDVVGCNGEISLNTPDTCAAFLNDGAGRFTLAPEGGDLEAELFSSPSNVLLDYDRDGILDFWPGTVGEWQYGPALTSRPRLYRGLGGGMFYETGLAMGLPEYLTANTDMRINFGITSCDLDLDGDRDVLIGQYGVPAGPNYVWRNDGDRFVNVAGDLGVDRGPSGAGGFTNAIACGDLDDDGDVDLFTAEIHHAWVPESDDSQPLINLTPPGGTLARFDRPGRAALGFDRPHVGGNWTEGDNQVFFADVDLDGRKDVYIASMNYPQQRATDPDWTHDWLYHQGEDGMFQDVTMRTPWWNKQLQSLGNSAIFDYDNDGDLDIVTGTATYNSAYLKLTNAVHVFRNEVGQGSNFVRLEFVGKGAGFSNVSGIGVRAEVTAGGRTQQQEVLGANESSQSDVTLTFGLGGACEIDRLVVYWPNSQGSTSTFDSVMANYLVIIREGQKNLAYRKLDGSEP